MSEEFSIKQWLEEGDEYEGGAGYVTQFAVWPGYYVYGKGLEEKNEERFWPIAGADSPGAEEAQSLAKEYGAAHGGLRYHKAFMLKVYSDSVLNREEQPTWTGGALTSVLVSWMSGPKKVFVPSIKPLLVDYEWGTRVWGRVVYVEDPDRPKYTKSDGTEGTNFIPKIVEFFPDETAALQAASGGGVSFPAPETWDESYCGPWREYLDSIVTSFEDGISLDDAVATYAPAVMHPYGVTPELIAQFAEVHAESKIPF